MEVTFVGNDDAADVGEVAVVIDVLRAFSFAAYAIDAGIDQLVLMADLSETLRLAGDIPGALAGKDGAPADGFELFNSPGQLRERSDLVGRTIVHCTTAGTAGAVAARGARHLFCASFVVAAATVDRIRRLAPASVTFVITGAGGTAPEDRACADYLAASLLDGVAPDPTPYLRRVEAAGQELLRGVELGYRGVHPDDLALCMDVDRFDFAMAAVDDGSHLVLRRA